jgi:ABC-type Fe3+ transport system, permease component
VPFYKTFLRVTVPVCLPSILQIARYLFVNGMTTVSAVAFLYSPDTQPASVAILNLDDAGQIGPAAAMATLVLVTARSPVCCLPAYRMAYCAEPRHGARRAVAETRLHQDL